MFAAAREKLLGAWRKLREGSLAKLFVFEFVVVMLGVLAAQWVADQARERQAMKEMEDLRAEAERVGGEAAMVLNHYKLAITCIDEQMRMIMRAANAGETLDPTRLRRPSLRVVPSLEWGSEMTARIEKRYGFDYAEDLGIVHYQAQHFDERAEAMIGAWRAFALLDPANGEPVPADYREARLAASEILTLTRGMSINLANVQLYADRLGLKGVDGLGGRGVRDCEELWAFGTMHLEPHEMDEDGEPLEALRVGGA